MKKICYLLILLSLTLSTYAQAPVKKVYNEDIDPNEQIAEAVKSASDQGKFVICQVGGNWCKWCLWFASFIENDSELKQMIDDNFVYIHVNYNPRNASANGNDASSKMLARLNHPDRFGYPALVVLNDKGDVIHTQDSSFLEQGEGYDKKKVMRFLKNWTPEAVNK